ncbi:multiple inositol polyphosphate phosphatase 1 isoform X1 [Vigna umbellata]|uniref:multiple inositol polyphosphate phosphatase 1 isoform X1 n=1 Tax=Vigna umbellata TaxID=87088 RepID=UPI001F5FC666|nr:multiple inositol polyphosphate phosphatase 1 isoform X1 [Vigna umbellata]XP_047161050.1 multiple inositol polyphosphate phosphatase 1 isoform X1 [Vigna umbellata]XP_047161051.1 multiple inositol polyphosphate phosphatase 1 isoform X1 [Vigna umbellata]
MSNSIMAIALLLFLWLIGYSNAEEDFDVRKHLSTVSRYGAVKDIADNNFVPSKIPEGCVPIHLNLVARHGTRSPTKKRIKKLDNLSAHLEDLVRNAKERNLPLERVPSWLNGWKSPWQGRLRGGELISKGEEELYDLGIRIRAKFPNLFDEEYHPDVYPIKASQIPRASASAVAFGMGLFRGNGSLGPGRHRAFAVTSESRASDILLRFHDCCHNYKAYRKNQEPAVSKLKEPILDEITSALIGRHYLNFTREDTSSLWFLCKQEASLLDITNQACGLFIPSEIELLEWTDDLEMFILKGYGKSLNYRMGVPLLEDVFQSMEQAIIAKEEKHASGSFEKARLRFAHAETLVPFSCLLGLFLEGSEIKKIQKEQPLQQPPMPPQKRKWRGSTVAPFAGNNMLVLYSCSAPDKSISKHFVQVLHNEHPIPLPGCDGSDLCPFELFKEKIVAPHQKHDYHTVCNPKLEHEPSGSKFFQIFQWLFSSAKGDNYSKDEF